MCATQMPGYWVHDVLSLGEGGARLGIGTGTRTGWVSNGPLLHFVHYASLPR